MEEVESYWVNEYPEIHNQEQIISYWKMRV